MFGVQSGGARARRYGDRFTRRHTAIVGALAISLVAVACGSDSKASVSPTANVSETTAAGTEPPATTTAGGNTTASVPVTTNAVENTVSTTPVDHSKQPTLTVAVHSAVISIDLSKEAYQWSVVRPLMHAFLTHEAPDGSIVPSDFTLAESWGYVGDDNKVFEMKLRKNAVFSDGTPVTAASVKAWLEYFAKGTGVNVSTVPALASIDVLDDYNLRLNLVDPNPNVAFLLSEENNWGGVSKVDKPELLSTETLSAGPYRLDPTKSIPDEEYTLVPNQYFWDQSAIRWNKVVVKVLTDPGARFRAVQTGQVDFAVMAGALDFYQPAKDAGLQTFQMPANTRGLIIADRGADGPLKDVTVRQALNYAIDRKAITTGLLGELGAPTSEFRTSNGFDPAYVDHYPYDPQKAKDLLAQAGYPDGFTLTMLGASHMVTGGGPLAQAVASYWDKIGVKSDFTLAPSSGDWVEMRKTLKYQVLSLTFLLNPVGYIYGFALRSEGPPPANPFAVADPELANLFAAANAAKDAKTAFQDVMRYTVDKALFVPVWDEPFLYVARDTVKGIELTAQRPVGNWATEWSPA